MKQLLLLCIVLYLSFNGYGQKKVPQKNYPPPPPVENFVEKQSVDTRLRNTSWDLTIDTSGNTKRLQLRKVRDAKTSSCLIHFIDEKKFLLTVNTKSCSFKAAGTYTLNFVDAGTEDVVQIGPPNMLSFNQHRNLSRCAEQIKWDIAGSYSPGYYDESGFKLEAYMVIDVAPPSR